METAHRHHISAGHAGFDALAFSADSIMSIGLRQWQHERRTDFMRTTARKHLKAISSENCPAP
jgi:hypothetical protein